MGAASRPDCVEVRPSTRPARAMFALLFRRTLRGQTRCVHAQATDAYKSTLRKLFKLVHPDRFGNIPKVREQNERAVQLMNQLISEWRRPSESERELTFPLSFYVPDTRVSEGLRHIELDLRLHPPYHTGSAALRRLFDVVGLGNDFSAEAQQAAAQRFDLDLVVFLRQALADVQEMRETTRRSNELCDQIMAGLSLDKYVCAHVTPVDVRARFALHICVRYGSHAVARLHFSPIWNDADILPFAERFLGVFDRLPAPRVSLAGLTVMFDEIENQITDKGEVCFDYSATVDDWVHFLTTADFEAARQRQRSSGSPSSGEVHSKREANRLTKRAQLALGVTQLYNETEQKLFDEFLQRVLQDERKLLSVRTLLKRVAANVKVIHSTSNPLGFSVAPDGGLCIPYTTAPEHLAQFLTQHVAGIANFAETSRVLAGVQRRLKVASLGFDHEFVAGLGEPYAVMQAAAANLETVTDVLAQFDLRGINLVLGAHMALEDYTLTLPHDVRPAGQGARFLNAGTDRPLA